MIHRRHFLWSIILLVGVIALSVAVVAADNNADSNANTNSYSHKICNS